MKRALVLSLALLIGLALAGTAKTNFFDALYIEGAFTLTGTAATSFVGTTFAVDVSSTGIIDAATSLDLISAGHVDIESADIRLGLDADDYMKLVFTNGSGNLDITHPGNTPAVTWTMTSLNFTGLVGITSGTITGITDLAVADGGTGSSNASDARTALGLAIGTNVQAWDAQLDDIAALVQSDSYIIVGDDTNWVQETGATARTSLGLAIGTDVQAYDAELAALAGLTSAANTLPYFTGSGTAGAITSSANIISWLASADYATARTNLGVAIGSDVLAYDAGLSNLASLTMAANEIYYTSADNTHQTASLTAFGRSILDDADEATFKATVNLEAGTDVQAYHANLAAFSIADNQPITEYIAFDIEEATMDGDNGSGIKVASVDVNATGLILYAYVNVTQGYSEASDTIELVINDTDDITTPITTLVGATDTSAAHLLAYQPATGATVLGATSITNRYVVVGYKDVGDDGSTGANLQGTLVVVYLKQ